MIYGDILNGYITLESSNVMWYIEIFCCFCIVLFMITEASPHGDDDSSDRDSLDIEDLLRQAEVNICTVNQ